MIKLNEKGFAVSTILYGILTLTILLLMLIFGVMKSNKDMNAGLIESLTNSLDKCAYVEARLEDCYLKESGTCQNEINAYKNCFNSNDDDDLDNGETNPDDSSSTKLTDKILADNTVQSDSEIDFSQISSATNGKGLYYTSTNTEGNQPTYYFRGAVENNYVQFGQDSSGNDILWRIVRINEDGSIRIIYNGTSTTATGSDVVIGSSVFNTNYDDNAYVGYMYGTTGSSTYALTHANTNNSTIKVAIDNWYLNNTNLSSLRATHLADAGFCNDRSISSGLGYGTNTTNYGAYNRLYTNKSPQFACPNASNDLFTTSTSSKGNKALTNPVGLITADEVWYAGATTSSNNTYYLYTGSYYWTMSPRSFAGSFAFEWFVSSYGYLNNYYVDYLSGVRPVANLQSGVEITGGDGTSGNPYIIK